MNKIHRKIKLYYYKFWVYIIEKTPTHTIKDGLEKEKQLKEYKKIIWELM